MLATLRVAVVLLVGALAQTAHAQLGEEDFESHQAMVTRARALSRKVTAALRGSGSPLSAERELKKAADEMFDDLCVMRISVNYFLDAGSSAGKRRAKEYYELYLKNCVETAGEVREIEVGSKQVQERLMALEIRELKLAVEELSKGTLARMNAALR